MAGKQVTELDALSSFTDNSLLPVHNGAGLKKGILSQLVEYLGTKFSNPNLLINPDFKINQRGASNYEKQGYSVDRWKIWNVTVTPNANGGITVKNDKYTDTGTFIQNLENATEGDSTLSCYVESVSGTVTMVADDDSQVILKQGLNIVHTSKSTKVFTIFLNQGTSITLKWAKLEQGTVATHFVKPNKADELLKCQRYYEKLEVILGRLVVSTSQNFSTSYKSKFYRILNGSYRAEKRATPTISIKGSLTNTSNGDLGVSANDFKSDAKSFRQFTVSAETNFVDVFITNVEVDAEIY